MNISDIVSFLFKIRTVSFQAMMLLNIGGRVKLKKSFFFLSSFLGVEEFIPYATRMPLSTGVPQLHVSLLGRGQ